MSKAVGVTSRASLGAVDAVHGQSAYLWESAREGLFVFDASDLSDKVSADTAQGVYVPTATAPTGSGGAWVRKFSGSMDVRWFGAVADSTGPGSGTDNTAAFNAAKAVGLMVGKSGEILVPKASLGYRVSSALIFTSGVKLRGQGFHENPGNVGGTIYALPQNYRGSILVFDTNTPGLQFIGYTDNNADATAFEYESSAYSVVEDLMIYGGGGTTVTAHGIEHRVQLQLRNVRIENFAGCGVKTIAYTAGAVPWGNANGSKLDHVMCRSNKCHGFFVEGSDSNIMTFINCDSALNGGVGYLDKSLIGNNLYLACHSATNNQSHGTVSAARTQVIADWAGLSDATAGSYVTVHAGGQQNVYLSCYVETGMGVKGEITEPNIVIGGTLAETGSRTTAWTANVWHGDGSVGLTVEKISGRAGLSVSHADGNSVDVANATGGTAAIRLLPGAGTYSNLQLRGNNDLIANGLDILAGSAAAYFSADSLVVRNAAQTVTFGTFDSSGLNLDGTKVLKVGGSQVVGVRGAALPADATDLATVIALANAMKARIKTTGGHGLVAD